MWSRAESVVRIGRGGACATAFALLAATLPAATPAAAASSDRTTARFVRTSGTQFVLDGKPFYVTGVNNHYLVTGSREEVLRVLDDAAAMGANVVRTYLNPVIGSLDGSVPTIWDFRSKADAAHLGVKGTYLLSWDPKAGGGKGAMAINDGPNGMQKVDFLIAEAGKRHLKLVLGFLDFWAFTGGAQQMRSWYGSRTDAPVSQTQFDTNISGEAAAFFFEDPRTKRDYRTWVEHVVRRVNPLTGTAYRDDPTIMAWELMNEGNAGSESLRLSWTAEMSAFVKSLDPNHLVGSGHGSGPEDRLSDLSVATLDFGTWHGYPIYWQVSVDRLDETIGEFCRRGAEAGKPVLLEEFGYARSNPGYVGAYAKWLDTLARDPDCAGWLVWRLTSKQDGGRYAADEHDQFDVHDDGGPLAETLKAAIARGARRPLAAEERHPQ